MVDTPTILSVSPPFFQRITAWLCLALVFLTGLTPAQGLVLCLEPDGCISVEIATVANTCNGCDGHEEGTRPSAPSAEVATEAGCPCVDLTLSGSVQEQRIQPKSIKLQIGSWIALPPPLLPTVLTASGSLVVPTLAAQIPRPADSLALIRSVVLLV